MYEGNTSLIKIYDRATEYSIAKWGNKPDRIIIMEDGNLEIVYIDYYDHDDTTFAINLSDLSDDLDVFIKERKKIEEERRTNEERLRKKREERAKIQMEIEEKATYFRLKEKYDK